MLISVLSMTVALGVLKNLTYGWPMTSEYICIVWDHGCLCKTLLMGGP